MSVNRSIRKDFVYSQGREHPCPKTMLPSLDTIHCSRSRQSSPKTLPDDHKYATKAHKWPPRESQTLPQQLKIGCAFKTLVAENVFLSSGNKNTHTKHVYVLEAIMQHIHMDICLSTMEGSHRHKLLYNSINDRQIFPYDLPSPRQGLPESNAQHVL